MPIINNVEQKKGKQKFCLWNYVKFVHILKKINETLLIKKYRNGGTLYTKTKSVLNVKGKYVIRLDHDNLYANKKAFITSCQFTNLIVYVIHF